MSGQQALDVLKSEALVTFKDKHGGDIPIFVEGRVGLIGSNDGDTMAYIDELREAGAMGAIVGGGLVPNEAGQAPLDTLLSI